MLKKRNFLLLSIVLIALVLTTSTAFAARRIKVKAVPVRNRAITGNIASIDGLTIPTTITVTAGAITYTVNVTAKTKIVRKFYGRSSLEEIGVGDIVVVRGRFTDATIDANLIRDLSIQRKGGTFVGSVKSIDAANSSFVLTTTARGDQTVTTSATTVFLKGKDKVAFGDIQVGNNVLVIGLWRKSARTINADRVRIKI
ncbi:MAG: hypothetical protein HY776_03255 [Actinobacteria bacterium]|nr:hypothetical protein [Actinomycetota bacterium]